MKNKKTLKFYIAIFIAKCASFTLKLLKRNVMYRVMPIMMQQIVFTKKEIENLSGVSRNAVSTAIDKLVQMNILVEDSTYAKLAYRYKSIYNVFLGKDSV